MSESDRAALGFEPGTSALWVGPPLSGTRQVALRAAEATDGPVVAVATGAAALDALAGGAPSLTRRIAAIGCVGDEGRGGDDDALAHVETVASPADLTGLSIALSQSLAGVGEDRRPTVVVDSLTTMALYQEFDRLTRFVRQLILEATGRDGAFVATVEAGPLDDQEMATLGALFDRRIETDGRGEFRRRRRRRDDHRLAIPAGAPRPRARPRDRNRGRARRRRRRRRRIRRASQRRRPFAGRGARLPGGSRRAGDGRGTDADAV